MISGLVSLAISMMVGAAELDLQGVADGVKKPVAEKPAASNVAAGLTVKYDVSLRGSVSGNGEEFGRIVAETLADARGWGRAGVKFVQVESGASMHIILAEPGVIGAISGCSSALSCRVGANVYINDDRWMNGSDSYNAIGVSLLGYRQMVVNHEVGHFLGHGHITSCETTTGLAPIMLQQSTGLRGCSANSWPLPSELWYKR